MPTESRQTANGGDTPKLRAACENCRQSKVKCNLSGKDTCIRCLRHGLPCRYRVANRSGKPKGSKNRSTLRKLGQLQEKKPSCTANRCGWMGPMDNHLHLTPTGSRCIGDNADVNIERNSLQEAEQPKPSESPGSHEMSIADALPPTMPLPSSCEEYSSLYGDPLAPDTPYTEASMSPTFLQKEFITKGLTSFPLSVHIPSMLQPSCDCNEALVFYLNHLRQIVANPTQLRFDQMLQGVQAALSVCRGFLQCPSGYKDNDSTSLLLCMSTLELTLQLFDYWMSYELLQQPSREHGTIIQGAVAVGYGEYEMGPEETRRIRRFLIRGRLLQCRDTLGLLREVTEMSVGGSNSGGGMEGSWLQQIIGESEAMTNTFLQALSERDCCICS